MSPPLAKIKKYNDRYVIFYDNGCPFSENALELLNESGAKFKSYVISNITDSLQNLISYFRKHGAPVKFDNNHRTKPIIFYRGKFIGGYTELKEHLQ